FSHLPMSNQQLSQLISLQQDDLYLLDLNKTTSVKLNLPFTLPPDRTGLESVPRDTSLDCKFKNTTGTVEDHCMYWIADRSHINNPRTENTILCLILSTKSTKNWTFRGELYIIEHYPCINNNICIKKWHSNHPWIYMTKHLTEFKSFEVVFACIARNNEVFIVVTYTRNGDEKVMAYNKTREMFTKVPFALATGNRANNSKTEHFLLWKLTRREPKLEDTLMASDPLRNH
ncbi:hypothetical protein HID58_060980, partial [Brassica napus]